MPKLQAKALSKGGMSFEVQVRGHKLMADLTPDKGGKDLGPTPPELLLGALAACSGIYAQMFALREGLDASGVEVTATGELGDPPMSLEGFRVHMKFPGLPADKREKAKAFVSQCLVSKTLCTPQQVELVLE